MARKKSPEAEPAVAPRVYRVSLGDPPQLEITGCDTPEAAFAEYRRQQGIVASDHSPIIELVGEPSTKAGSA
jgi:hypothetical protein